eukprot:Em0015g425a
MEQRPRFSGYELILGRAESSGGKITTTYIENLHDGRGYTVSIFGATSGTGDLVDVFDKLRKLNSTHPLLRFYDTLKKKTGSDVSGLRDLPRAIQGLGDDKHWRGAVWDVYVDEYWTFVAQFFNKTQGTENRPGPVIKTPLVKGFIVDTAINHGPDLESFQVILNKMKKKKKQWGREGVVQGFCPSPSRHPRKRL